MTVRSFRPGERCIVNGFLVEVERHARRTTFVRVLDDRLLVDEDGLPSGPIRVQLSKHAAAEPLEVPPVLAI